MSNSKLIFILKKLQEAKSHGVEESDLLTDWETEGNARVIKHRINKIVGDRNGIVISAGVWYLDEHYWSMTRSEFLDLLNRSDLRDISIRNNYATIAVAAISAILIVLAFYAGRPSTLQQCGRIFDYDITIEE